MITSANYNKGQKEEEFHPQENENRVHQKELNSNAVISAALLSAPSLILSLTAISKHSQLAGYSNFIINNFNIDLQESFFQPSILLHTFYNKDIISTISTQLNVIWSASSVFRYLQTRINTNNLWSMIHTSSIFFFGSLAAASFHYLAFQDALQISNKYSLPIPIQFFSGTTGAISALAGSLFYLRLRDLIANSITIYSSESVPEEEKKKLYIFGPTAAEIHFKVIFLHLGKMLLDASGYLIPVISQFKEDTIGYRYSVFGGALFGFFYTFLLPGI
eukprot:TRINITY_DN356_c4_g1_i1.p1 TRINITY_DN356_c4_g1~~TRINITY_DN356_c4_g1_i1.p1  ORF type:complete len:276 (-),score=122.24 TRINITY_DN356_c4_g1_i1:103-930(-)